MVNNQLLLNTTVLSLEKVWNQTLSGYQRSQNYHIRTAQHCKLRLVGTLHLTYKVAQHIWLYNIVRCDFV